MGLSGLVIGELEIQTGKVCLQSGVSVQYSLLPKAVVPDRRAGGCAEQAPRFSSCGGSGAPTG